MKIAAITTGTLNRYGKNFISENITKEDKDLFFGANEKFIEIQPRWCMAHILHSVGMFTSISQARKNGWNKPIPWGYTEITVGKKAKRQNIFILNIIEEKSNDIPDNM